MGWSEEAQGSAEHPELGHRRHTYPAQRRGPAGYALSLLSVVPFPVLLFLSAVLLGDVFGLESIVAAAVMSGLVMLGLFVLRRLRHGRPARDIHLYQHGLVAVAADGSEAVYPWASTTLFTDGWNRYKLVGPEGLVSTIGAAHRRPLLAGDRVRGMRTRTVIRGARFPGETEWGPAVRQGIRDSRVRSAVAAIRSGSEVAFGALVVSRNGLAVRRRRGRDDFTSWEDLGSVTLTDDGSLLVTSRGSDFPSHYVDLPYRVPNIEVLLDVVGQLHEDRAQGARERAAGDDGEPSGTFGLVGLYVTFGLGAWAAWSLGTRNEIDGVADLLLAAFLAVVGGGLGAAFGLGLAAVVAMAHEILVVTPVRWIRHRRYAAAGALALGLGGPLAALGVCLLREFPSRLVPLVALLFFGGWMLRLLMQWCGESERRIVRHLPDLPGVALVAFAAQQLVSGGVLTTGPAAGLFFPLAVWLSSRGRRTMENSIRLTVKAAADIALSVELGLLLALFMVWLANVLSLSPAHVAAVRGAWEWIQKLTEVHWLYWLVAYTLLALGSYAMLRWPDRVARIRQRLRPARFGQTRLPLGAIVNFGRRLSSGANVGLMVALLCAVVAVPVSEGAWKRPVAHRYALETQRRQYAEGAADAYQEIHQYITAHPRAAAQLRDVAVAVDRAAPSQPGEPVNGTALATARQVGRFQAATLRLDDPAPPEPAPEAEAPEAREPEDLEGQLEQLDESQQRAAEREQHADRFAEFASLAATRALDLPDFGDNGAVQIIKEYLGGLVEDGPVKKIFDRWSERIGRAPPGGDTLVRIDVQRLEEEAYTRTQQEVERADGDPLAFYGRFAVGDLTDDPSMARVVDLANQHRYLRQGTGTCHRCVSPDSSGTGPDGGGGRRR